MTDSAVEYDESLLTQQRRDRIRAELFEHGAVRTGGLSRQWAVSPMTVRRDLAALEAGGFAIRVHGGAVCTPTPNEERPPVPTSRSDAELHAIAAAAARTVRPGTAIGLSGGRAVEALAEELTAHGDLTVVTNSLRVADILNRNGLGTPHRWPTVILTGGHRGPGGLLVGPLAVAALRTMRVDTTFVDCAGADLTGGLTVGDLADAELRACLLRSAGRRTLLAESAVFGARSLTPFATLAEIDTVFAPPRTEGTHEPAREAVLAAVGKHLGSEIRRQFV